VAANSGQPFSYTSIGNTVGLNVETATNYITYLEKAKFIIVQPVASNNTAKTLRANKKIHILDNGIRNAVMKESNLDDARLGFAVESAFIVYAYAEAEKNLWNIGYQDTREIDIVIDKKKESLSVEVKYRNEPKITNKSQPKIVITKTLLKKDDNTIYIPFWLVR
jgi:predicted AAA+ superfamily ATPase